MRKIIRWLRAILGTGMSTVLMVSSPLPGVPDSKDRETTTPSLSVYQIGKQIGRVELLIERNDHSQASQMLDGLTTIVSVMPQHAPDREQIVNDVMNLKKRVASIKGLGK